MESSSFTDRAVPPDEAGFRRALGRSWPRWEAIRARLRERPGPLAEEWKHYGKTIGWQLKVLRGKRNLLFLTPLRGSFRIAVVLGDRAVEAAGRSGLDPALLEELRSARRYAEGRGVRVAVTSAARVRQVVALLDLKEGP